MKSAKDSTQESIYEAGNSSI